MTKQELYDLLQANGTSYECYEHPPVFTMEEMAAVDMPHIEAIVKNLFLRDDKGKNHYLVTVAGHKKVDVKALAEKIPSKKLSFASEQRLADHLGLQPGSVTPFGVLNNAQQDVVVVFDRDLQGKLVGIHPMENTATVFLPFEEVLALVKGHGNRVVLCQIPEQG